MLRKKCIAALAVILIFSSSAFAKPDSVDAGKKIGEGFKEIAVTAGITLKETGRAIGKGFKKAGEETGKAFKKMGQEISHAFSKK